MADISKVTLPSGNSYNIKDSTARTDISSLSTRVTTVEGKVDGLAGYTKFLGVTTTELTDGSTTATITIGGVSVTATTGAIATYGSKEFIWNGTAWQEFGDMSSIGALGRKDSASGSYTPKGTVSKPTFTGSATTSTGSFTPKGTINTEYHYTTGGADNEFTPKGTVSQPTFTGSATTSTGSFTPAGDVSVSPSTTTIYSITGVGTAPSWSASVSDETLSFSFSAGSVPTRTSKTVMTGATASFTGTAGNVSVSGTPSGTVSQPTFTGEKITTYSEFTGTSGSVSVSGTPSGTVSQPTFTGTASTVTVS